MKNIIMKNQKENEQEDPDLYTKNKKIEKIGELKKELQAIENDLNAAYVQIGRRFVERAVKTQDFCGLEIQDVLRVMESKAKRKREIASRIASIEKEMREVEFLREKEEAYLEYKEEKDKLDKALAMEVLTQQEYDQRLKVAKRKSDNFEEIRRVKQQYDMELITAEERDEKIKELTS